LLIFTKDIYFSFFVRSSQAPASSNGAPSCSKQWISGEGLLFYCESGRLSPCMWIIVVAFSSSVKQAMVPSSPKPAF